MSEETPVAASTHLHEQYDDLEQQHEAATLGMWVFLATEILFFGGLFVAYTVYRTTYTDEFERAGKELNLTIGTINTAVLLTSSLFMALAVHAGKTNRIRATTRYLSLTWILGFCFICLKAYEYYDDIKKQLIPSPSPGGLLYFIYYAMTGLHATHMIIGLGLVFFTILRARRGEFSKSYSNPLENVGLYWHFVDVIWIFLYPLLYLMDRSS